MKTKSLLFLSIVLLTALAFSGCDTGTNDTTTYPFSPPDWIIGTWGTIGSEFTFTSSNVLNGSLDYGYYKTDLGVNITEDDNTNTVYQITYGGSLIYRFEKVSDTTLNYYLANIEPVDSGDLIGLLTKQ